MSGSGSISTRLVKGSDLAVGKRVKVVSGGPRWQTQATVLDVNHELRLLRFDDGVEAHYLPHELEPAERAE